MQSHTKFHLQSISFAFIMLMFAMFWNRDAQTVEKIQAPREVQLTATVVDATTDSGVISSEELIELEAQAGGDKVEPLAMYEAAALDSEPAPSAHVDASQVVAASFLAIEANASEPIGEYQSEYRWPVASITKLMTALVALEQIGPEQEIMISEEAVATEGDAGGFAAGEVFTVRDLIVAMMTVSSNDAAAAIASYMGTPRFFDIMQERAYELKMVNTSFIDATGLSYLNQSTTRDVATLVSYIYEHYPEVLAVSAKATNKIIEQESGSTRTLKNINTFAGTSGFLGGKTGFTEESKGNLVSLFSYEDKAYVLVVFGTTDRFAETKKLWTWMKEKLQ